MEKELKMTKESFYELSPEYFINYLWNHPKQIEQILKAEEGYLQRNIKNATIGLEMGFGTGRIMRTLAEICIRVVGIDYSTKLFNLAERNLIDLNNIELHLDDIEKLNPLKYGKFDVITILDNTLGNIYGKERQINVLKKAKSMLKKRGKIIISVYSKKALKTQIDAYYRIGLTVINCDNNYVYTKQGLISERFCKEDIELLINSAGLKSKITKLTPIAYICECEC